MRALKLAGLATAMVLPLTAGAFAADAIMAPPAPPAAAPIEAAPVQLWTGPYAGVFLGYNWGDHEDIVGDDTDGISGGAYAGYNYQFDNFVVGAEADLGYSDANGEGVATVTGGVPGVREGEMGLFGSVRARAGVAFNPFLIYATGGVAVADIEYNQFDGSDSSTAVGYTVGGGVEGMVTDNITARLEYRYTDYGSDDYNINGNSFSSAYDEHSVRAGVGFKF